MEVFGYALKQQMHTAIDMVAVEMATFHPDEREQQSCLRVVVELIEKDVLMVAIGFAQLPLHTVAVYGMLEAALGHTEQQLSLGVFMKVKIGVEVLCGHQTEDGTQRESGQ